MKVILGHLVSIILLTSLTFRMSAQNITMRPNTFTPPRLSYDMLMTLTSPQEGDMVYDLTFKCLRVYNGSKWVCTFQNPADITPNLVGIAQVGGESNSAGVSVAIDNYRNVYVIGSFSGTAIFGNLSLTSVGFDIFIAKYNDNGVFQWVQQIKGGNASGSDIVVNGSGDVYVTGAFFNTVSLGSITLTSAGIKDIFVAKYSSSGMFQWVQKAGGVSDDYGLGIEIDSNENVYLTGYFSGTATFGNSSVVSSGDGADIFIAKYTNSGTFQWVQKAGGLSDDWAQDVAVDASGNVYVTGWFGNTATFGSSMLTSSGGLDFFIAKYNNSGMLLWVQKAGGTNNDLGRRMVVDTNNNIYVIGDFYGTATFGGNTITSSGLEDIFLAKYNTNGVLMWVQKMGGASNEGSRGIAVDESSNVYVTGYFTDIATFGNKSMTSLGSADAFITKYNGNGVLLWTQKAGGANNDFGYGIAIDVSGDIYVVGEFSGKGTFGSSNLTSTVGTDMFLIRIERQ